MARRRTKSLHRSEPPAVGELRRRQPPGGIAVQQQSNEANANYSRFWKTSLEGLRP